MIVKTDAVVLKAMKYGETSRIVGLYTRDHGKVSVMAKGARSAKPRFGGSLQPGTLLQVVYYSKPNRELQTLTQADVVERFRRTEGSLEGVASVLQMLEVVDVLTHHGQPQSDLYELLVEGIRAVNGAETGLAQVLIGFRLHVARSLGFTPTFARCLRCNRVIDVPPAGSVRFHVDRGGAVCASCTQELSAASRRDVLWTDHVMSGASFVALRRLLESPLALASSVAVDPRMRNEMENTLRLYERYHFERTRPLRTSQLVGEVVR